MLRKDRRAIAWADVRPLAIHLRRIVGDAEIDAKQLGVADLSRIVADPDRLGVLRPFSADLVEGRVVRRSAGITRHDVPDAFHVLEHRFHAPEASARQDGCFGGRLGGRGRRES